MFTAGVKRTQMVKDVFQLVHLGLGDDAVESDGVIRAAVRTIGGEVERVPPVPGDERYGDQSDRQVEQARQECVFFFLTFQTGKLRQGIRAF